MATRHVNSMGTEPGGDRLLPGTRSPRSGRYEFVNERGARTGVFRLVTAGDPLPPGPQAGGWYVLDAEIRTVYTSTASAAVIDETVAMFPISMRELAKR